MAKKKTVDLNDKEAVKTYAKRLYLTTTPEGKRRYTFRQIKQKIQLKFNNAPDHATIYNWSKLERWDNTYDDIQILAIKQAEDKKNDDAELNLAIVTEKANQKAEYLQIWKNILKGFAKEVFERVQKGELTQVPTSHLIQGMEKAFNAIANHLGLDDKSVVHKTIDADGNVVGVDLSKMSDDELKNLLQ